MHIQVKSISLASLKYEFLPENASKLTYHLSVNCKSKFPQPNVLIQAVHFNLFHDVENPPFTFEFTFVSVFSSEGEGSIT